MSNRNEREPPWNLKPLASMKTTRTTPGCRTHMCRSAFGGGLATSTKTTSCWPKPVGPRGDDAPIRVPGLHSIAKTHFSPGDTMHARSI